MVTPISRRHVLTAGVAVAAAGMPLFRAACAATAAQQLTATTRTLDVNGKAARVFGLVGPGGKSGLTLACRARPCSDVTVNWLARAGS